MRKKSYVKPILNSEEFVPQEYVAACEDNKIIGYKGVCDKTGYIFHDKGTIGTYEERTDNLVSDGLELILGPSAAYNSECSDTVITTERPTFNAWCFEEVELVGNGLSSYYKGKGEGTQGFRYSGNGSTHFTANINAMKAVKNMS